ncbi:MAG: hypothetical protein R6X32_17545 [Chloroflexota bacterium]
MPDKIVTSDGRICPECNAPLYFGGDGRSLQCDRCDYQRPVVLERSYNLHYLALSQVVDPTTEREGASQARSLLSLGIAAVKAGDLDEAYHYLERVIIGRAAPNEQARAWLWLSQVCDDPADKRECLEQVLAIEPTNGSARRGLALLEGRLQAKDVVDPDQLERVVPDEPVATEAELFRCYRCNGRMNYTPDGTALMCEFCGQEQPLGQEGHQTVAQESRFGQGPWEQDFVATLAQAQGHVQPVAFRIFTCHNCAVEFVLPPQSLSLTCPYCDAVYITETAETSDLLPPQALIPFALSPPQAEQILRRWFKKEGLRPRSLSPVAGLYLPVWTFDIGGEIGWRGQVRRGDEWVPASGNRYVFHDDVLVPATARLPAGFSHWLDEFDLSHLLAYDARFLADWPAERYQLPLSDASLRGRRQVLQYYRRHPREVTRDQYVRELRLQSTEVIIESFKLILLPVYLAHYRLPHNGHSRLPDDEETYDVLINGQNGVVRAERPEGVIGRLWQWLAGGEP